MDKDLSKSWNFDTSAVKTEPYEIGFAAPCPEMSNCKKIEKNQKQTFCINAVKREDDIEI